MLNLKIGRAKHSPDSAPESTAPSDAGGAAPAPDAALSDDELEQIAGGREVEWAEDYLSFRYRTDAVMG